MLTIKKIEGELLRATKEKRTIWVVDTDGTRGPKLVLKISPGGAQRAHWIMRYLVDGKRETWPLHKSLVELSLADARQEFARLKDKLDAGGLLKAQAEAEEEARRVEWQAAEEERLAEEAKQKYTLREMLKVYVSHLEKQGKGRSAKAAISAFKNISNGALDTPARDVTARQIAADVRRVAELGKDRLAGVLRSYLLAAFNLAAKSPYDPTAPSALIPFAVEGNPVSAIPAIPVKAGQHVLPEKDLKAYYAALGDNIVDQSLKVALLAGGQRMAQLLRVRVNDFDPSTKTLRLLDSKGRRKQAREHIVPLASLGAKLVKELADRARSLGGEYLFSADGSIPIHVSNPGKRLTEIATEIEAENFDLRDVRRTVETRLAALKVSRDVRAQLLSHGLSGVQQAHYDRHSYLDEKRAALRLWESWLTTNGKRERRVVNLDERRS